MMTAAIIKTEKILNIDDIEYQPREHGDRFGAISCKRRWKTYGHALYDT